MEKPTPLPLARLFNTPTARVLDLLISNTGFRYNEDEISKLARVPPRTLQRALKLLTDEEIIKRKRHKRVFYYEADLSSPRTNCLESYINSTMFSNFEQAVLASSNPQCHIICYRCSAFFGQSRTVAHFTILLRPPSLFGMLPFPGYALHGCVHLVKRCDGAAPSADCGRHARPGGPA